MSNDTLRPVTVLYTMPRSVYLTLPGVDCWDEERDARKWPGGTPVVAHPPCRLWGRMRHLSKAPISEKDLARHAVSQVLMEGGCLEHPAYSSLWNDQSLPLPGKGEALKYTLAFPQYWFGHVAEKCTWIFIAGVAMEKLPPIPIKLGEPTHVITQSHGNKRRRGCSSRLKSATPPDLAEWLVAVARLVQTEEIAQ